MAKYIVVLEIESTAGDPQDWDWNHDLAVIDVVCSVKA